MILTHPTKTSALRRRAGFLRLLLVALSGRKLSRQISVLLPPRVGTAVESFPKFVAPDLKIEECGLPNYTSSTNIDVVERG